ncbi:MULTISPECIES: hypothetical protein [Sulfurisphaera]|uniref:Uncharacterized protein n=3 Tax=Sulfurisphaera TaxID=69655 RepID=F9VN07_SULTO|nr:MULTISPECIES: hypothetical protein [Sulfurisphaera]MBB5252923.1 hypothetical protein [Sulfurisphaera ohwakuensis]QGR16146.1 hypothetical protein D1869_02285 [Sulfurisphaera ohwakuensis]BAK54304.1 hypothetical protein STK_04925 [Sulfurisphaera tokodaii str. 7]HII74815.1 hypothetical protein [Sulfurisphaera tokodaii]
MIIQVLYEKIDKELLSVIGILRRLKGEKEIFFSKSNRNEIFIDNYKVWETGKSKDEIIEEFYNVKIYKLVKNAIMGVSS